MNPLASVSLGLPSAAAGWAETAAPAVASGTSAAGPEGSRDAQMTELGSTTAQVNALQSLAMAAPAPITIPQTQNFQPPTANTSNELVDAMSAGDPAD